MTTLYNIIPRRAGVYGSLKAHSSLYFPCTRRFFSNGIVEEHDVVVLKRTHNLETYPVLTSPLRRRETVSLPSDQIFHNHIIGKRLREVVISKKGKEYRVTEPTLGEYTNLTPRIVTPIYPQDAAVIVNLLDLNPTLPGSHEGTDNEKIEIFEAGTGQGALTLHLARAVYAANTLAPPIPRRITSTGEELAELETEEHLQLEAYTAWLQTRRAIIQTLDISSQHSRHAQNIVMNYRNGMYYPSIDFHVGTIGEYISSRIASSPEPFLSHAILDLPQAHDHLELVAKALKPSGSLLVFCPSITQINTCALDVKKKDIPLFLENVVEIGAGVGVGGREWDVRPVRPRAFLKARAEAALRKQAEKNGEVSVGGSEDEEHVPAVDDGEGWELVCRPKVGHRVVGGGFVGLWKKMHRE